MEVLYSHAVSPFMSCDHIKVHFCTQCYVVEHENKKDTASNLTSVQTRVGHPKSLSVLSPNSFENDFFLSICVV